MSLSLPATVISNNAQWNPQGFPRAAHPGSVLHIGVAPKILSNNEKEKSTHKAIRPTPQVPV